ncbi:MAG: hypothetical protein Q8Q32_02075 [bacterium]|nr:hypothetical protein [bacterium]
MPTETKPSIKDIFEEADSFVFLARNHNAYRYREALIGPKDTYIPFHQLCMALEISADDLVEIFGKEGGNADADAPEPYYGRLGSFPLSEPEPFVKMAKLFGKTVRVCRTYGTECRADPIWTVHPDGKIEEYCQHCGQIKPS